MLDGEIFNCGDAELVAIWTQARMLQNQYNQCPVTERERGDEILTQLIGSRGENVWIAPPFFCDHGENIHLGNNVELNMNCTFLDCNKITIGDSSGIGPGVHIYTVSHPVNGQERLRKDEGGDGFRFWNSLAKPVTIGKNVWIGGGSIILPGITIGDNTTIGAGSVVAKSIPAGCLAVGNPCRVIKYL